MGGFLLYDWNCCPRADLSMRSCHLLHRTATEFNFRTSISKDKHLINWNSFIYSSRVCIMVKLIPVEFEDTRCVWRGWQIDIYNYMFLGLYSQDDKTLYSKLRSFVVTWSYYPDIWQEPREMGCDDACWISKCLGISTESWGFGILR